MAKANITIEFLGASRYLASGKSIDLWTLRHTLQQQGDGGIYSLILKVGEYDEPIDGLEKVELLWFGGKCPVCDRVGGEVYCDNCNELVGFMLGDGVNTSWKQAKTLCSKCAEEVSGNGQGTICKKAK